jgi:hypothetical protein
MTEELSVSEIIDNLLRLFVKRANWENQIRHLADLRGRNVVVSHFGGCYGFAGYVIAMNGSPPRGLIVWLGDSNSYNDANAYWRGGAETGFKRLREREIETVRAFLRAYERNEEMPLVERFRLEQGE